MKPKVLKTNRDYKAALANVERLMKQSASDADELELWSLLVEKYEDEHFPIDTPDPVEAAIPLHFSDTGAQSMRSTRLSRWLGSAPNVPVS